MDVYHIVYEYLQQNGFDGLSNGNAECACDLDDLFPCECEGTEDCSAGYYAPCDCGDHEWHIASEAVRDHYIVEQGKEAYEAFRKTLKEKGE